MERILQRNEEEMKMLCVAIDDTSSGICLLQSQDSVQQIEIAKKAATLIKKKSAILDMAKIEKEKLPNEIGKLRELLKGKEEAQAIFLCNLQLCGAMLGDEKYIEQFNYMRDQMMVMGKVWILGTSPYFAVLLSRKARDLYSCIMNHFEFEMEEEMKLPFEILDEPLGDIRFNIQQFEEYKKRIEAKAEEDVSTEQLFQMISLWDEIRGYYNRDTEKWILDRLKIIEKRVAKNELQKREIRDYLNIARAYAYAEEMENSLKWIDKINGLISQGMSEQMDVIADSYKLIGGIYAWNKEYKKAEEYFGLSLECYKKLRGEYSKEGFQVRTNIAESYRGQKDYERALMEYLWIKQEFVSYYGNRDMYIININNGLGNTYMLLGQYSKALKCYEEALEEQQYLIPNHWDSKITLLNNLSLVNRILGSDEKAEQYLKEALELDGGFDNRHTLRLYANLYAFYEKKKEWEKAVYYGNRAMNLARKLGNTGDESILKIAEKIKNRSNNNESI